MMKYVLDVQIFHTDATDLSNGIFEFRLCRIWEPIHDHSTNVIDTISLTMQSVLAGIRDSILDP